MLTYPSAMADNTLTVTTGAKAFGAIPDNCGVVAGDMTLSGPAQVIGASY
jgi:hypothetical protein